MAVALILDLPGVTKEQYATARGLLREAPHPGNLVHVTGTTENGWRVVEVWYHPEEMGTFFQSAGAGAAFQAAGIPPALVVGASPADIPPHTRTGCRTTPS